MSLVKQNYLIIIINIYVWLFALSNEEEPLNSWFKETSSSNGQLY